MWSDELQQPTLVRQQAFFAGAWRDADNQQTLDVINPASGERLATIPALGAPETTRAIEYAEQARHKWAKTPNAERAALLETWYQ
ncbi:aldehyde dehydrogenase family protein, partial [Klebsiella pneumoniae]|nr:aldehyde dehydrogenase family protein [Klebsiella pneumoniae]